MRRLAMEDKTKKLKWWHYMLLAIAVVIIYAVVCVLLVLLAIPIGIDEMLQALRKRKGSKTNAK
jgi:uncharacterized membrane-anchored protein